jgi:shikimate 5-dehydrogenase
MFVGQAVEQFRLFTGGVEPPVAVMEAALLGKR